jgi:hypothetical protein
MELETDDKGLVSFLPVLTWGVWVVQGRTVGLAADYYANAEDAAAQKLTRIQLHLDPAPAASLGRALISHAERVQAPPADAPH